MKQFLLWNFFLLAISAMSLRSQVIIENDQTAESFDKQIYGLGFSAGPTSGVGMSFRNHFPSKTSIQLVLGIIKDKQRLLFSAGAEFQYDVVRGQTTRFYLAPAVSYFYSGEDSNTFESPFRFGAGIGGEFKVQEALHVSFEGIFTYFKDGSIYPVPQIALHYYFY